MASSTDNKLLENPAIREAIDALFLLDSTIAHKVERFILTFVGPTNVGRLITGLHALLGAAMLRDRILLASAWTLQDDAITDMVFNNTSLDALTNFQQTELHRRISDKYYEAHLCFRQAKMLPTATAARKERELQSVCEPCAVEETPAVRRDADDAPNRSPKRARNDDYCPDAPTSPLGLAKEVPVADEIDRLW